MSQDTVSRWERGDGYPDLRELLELCTLFEVAPNYMLGLSDQEHGLQAGMFLVDMEKVANHGYDELLAVQIPVNARVVDYQELQRLIPNAAKKRKRR